jgi:PAS domain S-box-containing protein
MPDPKRAHTVSAYDPRLLDRVRDAREVLALFDHLPRVYLYVKDRAHRFVKVNRGLLELLGLRSESEILGKTDLDITAPVLAEQYLEEDRRVMESRQPLPRQAWLVPGADGIPRWFISTKLPLFDRAGEVIGLAGVMQPYDQAGEAPGEYRRLTPAIEFVLSHYGEPLTLEQIASKAHLSISQLRREFQRLFGLTPGDYLLKVRLLMARRALEQTGKPVGIIAQECGFYDQSHFTRAFGKATGLRPLEYRARFAPTPRAD